MLRVEDSEKKINVEGRGELGFRKIDVEGVWDLTDHALRD